MILYTGIILIIITLTRVLAYWGVNFLKNSEVVLIKDVFHFTYVENTGAAFGIFKKERKVNTK